MKKKFTGLYTADGKPIHVGDTLYSADGYFVIVRLDKDGVYGQLVCKPDDSCAQAKYNLNGGNNHYHVSNREITFAESLRLENLYSEIQKLKDFVSQVLDKKQNWQDVPQWIQTVANEVTEIMYVRGERPLQK